jgi:CRP/FNR family transcriptional regulator, cyclic AMP receptor protein
MARPRAGRGPVELFRLELLRQRSWDRPTVRDWTDVLASMPLFSNLSKRHVRELAKHAKVVDYAPGAAIVEAGERGDALYLVVEGRATVAGKSGALRPGDFFGEMALVDGQPRSRTILAKSQLRAMKLPRRAFLQALEQDPKVGLAVMKALAERVRRLEGTAL